jgi:hypothetical protein
MSLLAAVFVIHVGLCGVNVGALLWPAAAVHLIFAILLACTWMSRRRQDDEGMGGKDLLCGGLSGR